MVTVTIDGKPIQANEGQTIIEVARANGMEIPHFCWHPKLTVAGNCRMCLVDVEKNPKLVIACSTQVTEGMIVHTANERVIHARQAVMEFLLINHPLDCPICDEAGECKLQDYAYSHSIGASRFDEDKVHKPKRVELGPNVLLDTERCIMCSRCVRFCDEIAHKPQLTFTQRGDHVELTTFPGETLDNPYSMNTIDICPVGALTSRDFRFKARVWEMSATESVCPGCSRGCNIFTWVRNNEILRLTPRFNPDVNDYWMCDAGRLNSFRHVNADTRLKSPQMRKDQELAEVGWDEAIARAASELKTFRKSEIAVIASPYSTNEDIYLLQKFAHDILGTRQMAFRMHEVPGDQDEILIRADKTPNARGATALGIPSGAAFDGIIRDEDAPEPAGRGKLVEHRPGQRHIEKVGAVRNLELLVDRIKLLEIQHGLKRSHAHRHAHDQTLAQRLGERLLVDGLNVIKNGFQLRWVRGIQNVHADFFEKTGRLIEGFVFRGSAHTGPDQILERNSVSFLNPLLDFRDLGFHLLSPIAAFSGQPGEMKHAVAVLGDAIALDLHADLDEAVAVGPE